MTMFNVLASACSQIPCPVFSIAHVIEMLIKWAVPVILIVLGMLDFGKAAAAQDEGDIAKAKQTFIKRLLSGLSVFIVMSVLELTFNLLASSAKKDGDPDGSSVWECVNLIFSGTVDEKSGLCDSDEYGQEKPEDKTDENTTDANNASN